MSQKVNHNAIGAFVLGAIVILIAAIVWVTGSNFGAERSRAVMVFDGSAKGLRVGAPVALKGVTIGQVIDIDIVVDTSTFQVLIPVTVEFMGDKIREIGAEVPEEDVVPGLIDKGLRGQLRTQSLLTGLLFIQMDFHPNSRVTYQNISTKYDQFPTIPTDMDELSRSLAEIDVPRLLAETQETLSGINDFVTSEQTQLSSQRLNETLQAIQALSDNLSAATPALVALMENSNATVTTLRQEIPGLSAQASESLQQFNDAAAAFESVMANAEYNLSDNSPVIHEVIQAARELSRAGKSLQSLADTLEAQPESILKGKSPLR